MTAPTPTRFNLRSFVAFCTTWSFLLLLVSGLVLFVQPPGRIAYWNNWTLLGLDKAQWDGLHLVLGIIFIVAGAVHLYLNWRAFWGYIVDRARGGLKRRLELVLSLALVLGATVGTLAEVPPFISLVQLSEWAKASWQVSRSGEPPSGHAELLSLRDLCKKQKLSLEHALELLRADGVTVSDPGRTLKEIAADNSRSPSGLFTLIKGAKTVKGEEKGGAGTGKGGQSSGAAEPGTAAEPQPGMGWGQMTLRQVCSRLGVDLLRAQKALRDDGFEPHPDSTLRQIAGAAGKHPHAVLTRIHKAR